MKHPYPILALITLLSGATFGASIEQAALLRPRPAPTNQLAIPPRAAELSQPRIARIASDPGNPPLYRSGCVPVVFVPIIPAFYTGIQFGPIWSLGLDYEGEDIVLLNTNDTSPVFDGCSGDMLRVSINRRWRFSPAGGTPKYEPATYTLEANPDTPTILRLKPWKEAPVALDAIDLRQSSDADRRWLVFGQGSGLKDFRLGFVRDALCIYNANGATAAPDKPGRLIFKLWPNGDVWFAGKIRTEPK